MEKYLEELIAELRASFQKALVGKQGVEVGGGASRMFQGRMEALGQVIGRLEADLDRVKREKADITYKSAWGVPTEQFYKAPGS